MKYLTIDTNTAKELSEQDQLDAIKELQDCLNVLLIEKANRENIKQLAQIKLQQSDEYKALLQRMQQDLMNQSQSGELNVDQELQQEVPAVLGPLPFRFRG